MTQWEVLASALSSEMGLPISIQVSKRATRLTMRMDPAVSGVCATIPFGVSQLTVASAIRSNEGWIRSTLRKIPSRIRLLPGTTVPLLGKDRLIRQDDERRFSAGIGDGPSGPEILVGRTEFPENRVVEIIRGETQKHMSSLTQDKAAVIGKTVRSVSIKNTTSRWGSCSSTGDIAYSWRMGLAPIEISDYLVAHEVAHLAEMNHGPQFWRVCRSISGIHPDRAQAWLKHNGGRLHAYGPAD